MLTPRRHRDPAHAAAVAGQIYGGSMRDGASRISELLRTTAGPGPGRGYYYQLLAAAGWTSLPLLPLVRQPTLILAGDDDPLTPLVNARIMHRLIPRSELHIYHGGHLALVSEPEPMAAIVEAFLTAGTGAATRSADGPPAIRRGRQRPHHNAGR